MWQHRAQGAHLEMLLVVQAHEICASRARLQRPGQQLRHQAAPVCRLEPPGGAHH